MAAHAFSIKYLNSLEPYIKGVSKSMVDQVQKDIQPTIDEEGYGTVDLWRIMSSTALDIIGETAFGETFHMLEDGTHPLPKLVMLRMKLAAYVSAYPSFFKIFIKGPSPKIMNVRLHVYVYSAIHANAWHSLSRDFMRNEKIAAKKEMIYCKL